MSGAADQLTARIIALRDIIECLAVELAEAKALNMDGFCDRLNWIAAVRRDIKDMPASSLAGKEMFEFSEYMRGRIGNPPGPPPVTPDP